MSGRKERGSRRRRSLRRAPWYPIMFVLATMAIVIALHVLPAAGATGDAAPPNPAWVLPNGTLDPTQVPETQYMGADGQPLLTADGESVTASLDAAGGPVPGTDPATMSTYTDDSGQTWTQETDIAP